MLWSIFVESHFSALYLEEKLKLRLKYSFWTGYNGANVTSLSFAYYPYQILTAIQLKLNAHLLSTAVYIVLEFGHGYNAVY